MALALTLAIAASGMDRPYAILMLALAVATGFTFVNWETRATAPVFDPGLFRIRAFAAGTSIIALQNFSMYGLLFELPQFFQRFRETPPREVGYLLFAMMIGMVFAAPVGGRLTDRLGARKSCLVGTACLLAGALLMRRLKSFVVPPDAFLPLLLFGIGMGLCSAPAQSSLMSAVGPERVGMAAGVSSTLRYLGGIGGILVLGVVLGSDADVTAERHVAMAWVYVAAIAISSLACFRLPGRVSGNAKPPPRPSRPRRGSPR